MSNYINIEEEQPIRCLKPSIKYLYYYDVDDVKYQSFNVAHISKCARVCYGKENTPPNIKRDIKTFQSFVHNEHLSMLRHDSFYFIINVANYHPENMMRIVNIFLSKLI